MTLAADLAVGFDDPVFGTQETFRVVLNAFSQPGTTFPVKSRLSPPDLLSPTLAAAALTLVDHETSVYLSTPLNCEGVLRFIAFHTGAPIVNSAEDADFILGIAGRELPDLMALKSGTSEYPDQSATLLLDVGGFGSGESVSLSGPGIDGKTTFAAAGLDHDFWTMARRNSTRFPLGVDFLFCSPDALAGLPRSTLIAV